MSGPVNSDVSRVIIAATYRCLHGTAPSCLIDSLRRSADTNGNVTVSGRPSPTHWLSHRQTAQHSATAHSQWLRRGRGTACLRRSGPRRHVASDVAYDIPSGAENVPLPLELLVCLALFETLINCTNVPAHHWARPSQFSADYVKCPHVTFYREASL